MLFSWKRRAGDPPPHLDTPAFLHPMKRSDRDWSEFQDSSNWPSIKVWLSQDQLAELDGLAAYRDQTRSEVMRDLLFIALYGHYTYAQLMIECRGLPREPGPISPVERSFFEPQLATYKPTLSSQKTKSRLKRTENLRLFLPSRMKTDISVIAKSRTSTVSETTLDLIQIATKGLV